MTKIYVLTQGSYSDYHIIGLFSTQELVKHYQDIYEDRQIEELELVDLIGIQKGWRVWMDREGKASTISSVVIQESNWNYGTSGGKVVIVCEIIAKTKEGAVKIANEYRVQLIASGEWDREIEKEKEELKTLTRQNI